MDSLAFDYLLHLAALSITFVGFATIVVTLRRTLGGDLSPFYVLLVRVYVETGLIVTLASLLPSLLNLLGLPGPVNWRVSSALLGSAAAVGQIVYIRRQRRIRLMRTVRYVISECIYAAVTLGLGLNVLGVPFPPSGWPYALALTWVLLFAGLIFLQTLDEVLHGKPTA